MFTVFEAEVGKSSELQNENYIVRPLRTHSDVLCKELNWTTLEARRLCLVYKYARSQVPATLSSRFEANKGRTKGSMRLYQRGANTNHSHSKELKTNKGMQATHVHVFI